MNRPLIRFAMTALIAALGITTAFAGGGTRFFVGESIPVVDKAIVRPAPQPKNIPHGKPTQGSNLKPDPKPGPGPKPGPRPRPSNEVVSVVYYTDGFEVNIGQPQPPAQDVQPQAEQAVQNAPSPKQKQEMPRRLQEPVTQQVEQPVKQLPQPVQEPQTEPIIITPQSANAGNSNGSKSKRRSKWTYDIPGMTGGDGNGPLIYNP